MMSIGEQVRVPKQWRQQEKGNRSQVQGSRVQAEGIRNSRYKTLLCRDGAAWRESPRSAKRHRPPMYAPSRTPRASRHGAPTNVTIFSLSSTKVYGRRPASEAVGEAGGGMRNLKILRRPARTSTRHRKIPNRSQWSEPYSPRKELKILAGCA